MNLAPGLSALLPDTRRGCDLEFVSGTYKKQTVVPRDNKWIDVGENNETKPS